MSTKNDSNLFEIATRKKLRFESKRGPLTIEQLWEVPLRSKDGFDLNEIALRADHALDAVSEPSFVPSTKEAPEKAILSLTLDIIKRVIEVLFNEEERAKNAALKRAEKAKLLDALAEKEDAELKGLSKAEILKRINKIDASEEE